MLWIGGEPDAIKTKFHAARQSGFKGLDQVQLHLHPVDEAAEQITYPLDPEFLREALRACTDAGLDLEVLPYGFDEASIEQLLDTGIRWYATDYPKRFADCVWKWEATR